MKKSAIFLLLLSLAILGIYFLLSYKLNLLSYKAVRHNCENGYYKTSTYGITDGSSAYYNAAGDKVGTCKSFIESSSCKVAIQLVGNCEQKGEIFTQYTPTLLLKLILVNLNISPRYDEIK